MMVRDLEPRPVWGFFADLSAIPRASNDEARARDWVKGLAASWGLPCRQDQRGNLVVAKTASLGRESSPVTVLQAHLDMVCEQEPGGTHDFTKDPIQPWVDGEWVRAKGTTLGADNGIGVALILAVLADRSLVHGPLEAVFTVDEEAEMSGAAQFDASLVTGRRWLNLDGEGSGRFVVGSAGGGVIPATVPLTWGPADAPAGWKVVLDGLVGGHSGVDIGTEPGNALALMARFLDEFLRAGQGGWQLASFEGGDKDNAIPHHAEARLAGPADGSLLIATCARAQAQFAAELGPLGTKLTLRAEPVAAGAPVLAPHDQQTLLDLVSLVPTGVLGRSKVVPGLVETSANLGRLRLADGAAHLLISPRSSSEALLQHTLNRIRSVVRLAGGKIGPSPTFPAWDARPDSPLRDTATAVWTRLTGRPATVELIHAGLECGFWAKKVPGIDMVSYGADALDLHTTRERVRVASVAEAWTFTVALLEAL